MGSLQSHRNGIQKAQRRTILLKSLIALTFLVSWGPYYGKGIYDWFIKKPTDSPSAVSSLLTLFVNCFKTFYFKLFVDLKGSGVVCMSKPDYKSLLIHNLKTT